MRVALKNLSSINAHIIYVLYLLPYFLGFQMFIFSRFLNGPTQAHVLMSRWRLSLNVMARAFCDDVGQEPGSILLQLAGFPIKAARFRKEMERLRNSQGKDLILEVGIYFICLKKYIMNKSNGRLCT